MYEFLAVFRKFVGAYPTYAQGSEYQERSNELEALQVQLKLLRANQHELPLQHQSLLQPKIDAVNESIHNNETWINVALKNAHV